MNLPEPVLVIDQSGLELCISQCFRADAVAIDTEFVRTDTFYPRLGLIQLSDGDRVWLVDPLAIDDFSLLKALLMSADVIKVFHSCSEDLEVLRHEYGVTPEPLFDTQIAAAFLDYGFSRGYSAIVEAVLGVTLDKHETRSDWLQRPLSESQLKYAAEDVYFLMKVYRKVVEELEGKGRLQWMAEEMNELVQHGKSPDSIDDYYLRVKGAWRLTASELATLRALTVWRETEARERDRPRNRILSDKALLELLRFKPQQLNGLYSIDGFHKGVIRRYGERIMEIVQGEADPENLQELPEPLDKEGRSLLSHCRQKLESKAGKLGMAPELLARKKDLEPLVKSVLDGRPTLPLRLAGGWRGEVIGDDLLGYVSSRGDVNV